jgi:hypothetical protein
MANVLKAFEDPQQLDSYSLRDALVYYGFCTIAEQGALQEIFQKASIIPDGQPLESLFPANRTANQLAFDMLTMIQETQRTLTVRTGTQERWEIQPQDWMRNDPEKIVSDLTTLGFLNTIEPKQEAYDAVCILGSTSPKMEQRLIYTDLLSKKGFHFKSIILLTGERYVTKDIDGTEEELSQLAQCLGIKDWQQLTETDLFSYLYDHSPLSQDGLPCVVINTPRRMLPRPTTQTTVLELISWLKVHPDIQKILFVSNQPNVAYQAAIIESVFSEEGLPYHIEVAGPSASTNTEIQILLEGLGSYLWAVSPALLSKMNITITDPNVKESFKELYAKNPFIYDTLPKNIRE